MSRVLALLNFKLLGFAIVSLAVVLGVAVSQLLETRRFIGEVAQSHQRTLGFRMVRNFLLDAETGQRGYLLTGREEFLTPWHEAVGALPAHMDELEASTAGLESQAPRAAKLRSLAMAKLEDLKKAIGVRRDQGLEAALPLLDENKSRRLMNEARELVAAALRKETSTLAKMQEQQMRGVWVTTFLIIASALLCLAAGVNAFLLYQKAIKASRIQRRAMIQRRRALNADREKSRFMANMSHEIRTPMNAIIGFSQLLREEVESPRARHYVNAIGAAGENLLSLINDVLDLSKIEAGRVDLRPEVIDIREVVTGLQLMLSQRASEKSLKLETEVAEDVPAWLLLDPLRLRQMLLNLLGNAIKFTVSGRVALRVHCQTQPGVQDSLTLVVDIEDTGRGIEAADLELIFKPFRQGSLDSTEMVEGTGLGLSITRRLAQLMGGSVTAVSVPGHGSTFTLTLPQVAVATGGPEAAVSPADAVGLDSLAPLKVLIVDDNAHNREVMGAFFHNTHHDVAFATNGLEAVEMAVKNPPDVILMDIRMPRLDGREATELIHRHDRLAHTPVIAVTASSLSDSRSSARAKFDGYLRKPFLRPQLVEVIRNAVAPMPAAADSGGDGAEQDTADAGAPLPGEAAAHLRALLADPWPSLVRNMGVRSIRAFAEELDTLAAAHSSPGLRDYATTLKNEAATYQISRMEHTLAAFPDLVENHAPATPPAPAASES